MLKQAYESGENSPLLINNYAAVLLDLNRDSEALKLLQQNQPAFAEYCSNYAIALSKSAYDIALIRKWNEAASGQPKKKPRLPVSLSLEPVVIFFIAKFQENGTTSMIKGVISK